MSINLKKIIWLSRALLTAPLWGKMGKFCYLGNPCFIAQKRDVFIGDKVRIYPGFRSETLSGGTVSIGNNVSIGQNFHVVSASTRLTIGNDVAISGNVFISNCDHTFDDDTKMCFELPLNVRNTSIGDMSFVGYGAVILAGTTLGKHCVIGANSVVRGEYPDNVMIAGNPAQIIKKFDSNEHTWKRCEIE
mgnify:CR=1 FL=1